MLKTSKLNNMNNFERTFETKYGNQTAETSYSVEHTGANTWSLVCEVNFEGERGLYRLKTHDAEFIDTLTYLQGEEKQDAIAEYFWSIDKHDRVLLEVVDMIHTYMEENDEECERCAGDGSVLRNVRTFDDGRGGYDLNGDSDDCPRCNGRGECSMAKNY
jgi:hypothetical protein